MTTFATIANMEKAREIHGNRVISWSPLTGEEYSANPGDYWQATDEWVMKDSNGEPMILVVRQTNLLDALHGFTNADAEGLA